MEAWSAECGVINRKRVTHADVTQKTSASGRDKNISRLGGIRKKRHFKVLKPEKGKFEESEVSEIREAIV